MVLLEYQGRTHKTVVCIGDKSIKLNVIILRLTFLVLGIMSAFRGMDIANDTVAYYRTYQNIAHSGFLGETRMEIGYVAFNVILSHVFKDNLVGFHVLLFSTSAFCYLILEQWIERHASSYGICIIAFYFLMNSGYMSAIRQSVAMGFVLCALMVWENVTGYWRYIIYAAFMIAAVLFHKTAIFALVFPFIGKRQYTKNTTLLIVIGTLILTATNFVSRIIYVLGLGTGYVTTEMGNAVNVGVMSILYAALLLLRLLTKAKSDNTVKNSSTISDIKVYNTAFDDNFYTYCIAFCLAITLMSLRAPGISRLNMYMQLAGLPYIANIINRVENPKAALIIKVIFSVAVWSYSVIALVFRPEWQHLWPYHFYWQ